MGPNRINAIVKGKRENTAIVADKKIIGPVQLHEDRLPSPLQFSHDDTRNTVQKQWQDENAACQLLLRNIMLSPVD